MRLIWVAVATAVASLSFGGQLKGQSFSQEKGVREFSGRVIARPIQARDLSGKGDAAWIASIRRNQALNAISGLMVAYAADTDEALVQVPRGYNENSFAKALMATGNFEYVEPDWIVYPAGDPNDPLFPQEWHLSKIGTPTAWDWFVGNGEVTVALCDTGVRLDHEDLWGRLVPGYNSISGLPQANGGAVSDVNGHGTMTAGVAGASGNNSRGVSGIGWGFNLMPIRVTNNSNGSTTTYAIITGARWAADHGARIVSVSYSGVASAAVGVTGEYVRQRNSLLFWAAGNSNQNLSGFDHLDVTVVGATDSDDGKEPSSSYGRGVDLFAPGADIWTTLQNGGASYGSFTGTSAATPCAAGVAALIMAANPWLSADEVEAILLRSCRPLSGNQNDDYWGWGRVDAANALFATYAGYLFPASGIAVSGAALSGNVQQLQVSDDDELNIRTVLDLSRDTYGSIVTLSGYTSIACVGSLQFKWEGRSDWLDLEAVVQLFDYSIGQWVIADRTTLTNMGEVHWAVPANPQRFVENGTGRMMAMLIFVSPLSNWSEYNVQLDQAGWFTAAP
jgi:subtilisin family serine protease